MAKKTVALIIIVDVMILVNRPKYSHLILLRSLVNRIRYI